MARQLVDIHIPYSEVGELRLSVQQIQRSKVVPIDPTGKRPGTKTIIEQAESPHITWAARTYAGATPVGQESSGGSLPGLVESGVASQDLVDRTQAVWDEWRDAFVRQLGLLPPEGEPEPLPSDAKVGDLVRVPSGQGTVAGEILAVLDDAGESILVVKVGSERRVVRHAEAKRG